MSVVLTGSKTRDSGIVKQILDYVLMFPRATYLQAGGAELPLALVYIMHEAVKTFLLFRSRLQRSAAKETPLVRCTFRPKLTLTSSNMRAFMGKQRERKDGKEALQRNCGFPVFVLA